MRAKEIMKEKGITVIALAEKLGVSRITLAPQLQGRCQLQTAERIAEALGVELWELFVSPEHARERLGESDFLAVVRADGETRVFADRPSLRAYVEGTEGEAPEPDC